MTRQRDDSLAFLESANDTKSIGAFSGNTDSNTFDHYFAEAVKELANKNYSYFADAYKLVTEASGAIMEDFKDTCLAGLIQEATERTDAEQWGSYSSLTDQISQMWDNVKAHLVEEATNVGSLRPIVMIDFPVMVKQHLQLATKDVVQTTVVDSPIVKRHIERRWITDSSDPTKRWEYPQCFFNQDYKEIFDAGKGYKIKDEEVPLPLFNYDIIDELTDASVPQHEKLSYDLRVVKAITTDGDEIPMDMRVDLHLGMWAGGKIHYVKDDTTVIDDELTGSVDYVANRVSLSSAAGKIAKVVFSGYISNENNERNVEISYTRDEKEWQISDGHKVLVPYSMEQLTDAKALVKLDLYQKTYTDMSVYLADMEDSKVIDFLDSEFEKYCGIELDPLGWNSFVRFMDFDCDSTTVTTATPAEYIEQMLKFHIDRFMIDLTEAAAMENMTFVVYGNPRYISLLGDKVTWVIQRGETTTGGIRHNYSYGIMNTGGTRIQVVSALKFSSKDKYHKGLRVIPYPMDKEQMTFAHFKFDTHIHTEKDSDYHAASRPGGAKTVILGVSRYADASVQGVQGYMTFSNAGFVRSKTYKETDPALL